jgi:hypothetical protein
MENFTFSLEYLYKPFPVMSLLTVESAIPVGEEVFHFSKNPDRLWGPPSLLFNGKRPSFPGIKRPECEIDNLPTSNAQVKSEWGYNSTLPLFLPGLDREKFTST